MLSAPYSIETEVTPERRPLVPVPKTRKPRVPGRGKGKIWIGSDIEFTDEEIKELFEAPLSAEPR